MACTRAVSAVLRTRAAGFSTGATRAFSSSSLCGVGASSSSVSLAGDGYASSKRRRVELMESSSGSRLMSAAASASSSPSPVDVRSLLGSFRLRKAGKWADVAPYLAEINIEFDPALDGTTGCKELWRQSRSKKIRALHPKYTVGLSCNEHGTPAAIKAKYQDGKTVTIDAQNKSLPELINALLEATESMKDKEDQVELDKN